MRFSSSALMATLVCLLSSYASAHTISRPAGNSLIQSNIKYRNIEAVVEGTGDQKPEPDSLVDDDCDEAASVAEDCDEDNEDQDDDCDDIAVEDDCDDDENDDDDETDDCDEDDTTPVPMPSAITASAHAGPKTAQANKTATPAATTTGPSQQNLAQAPQSSSSVPSEPQHTDCETVSHWYGSADSQIKTVYITVTETALDTAMLAAKPTGISFTDTTSSPATPQPSPTPAVPPTEDDGADDDEIPFCDEDADTSAIASPAAQMPTKAGSAASPAKTTAGAAATGQDAAVEDNEPECDDEADEEASHDDEECDDDSSSDQVEIDDCEEDGEPTPASMNSNLFASPQQEDGANANSTTGADFKSHDNTASQSASVTSVSASRPSPAKASGTAADAMLAEQDPVDGSDGMTTVTGAVPAIVTGADAGRRRRARHWVG